MRYKQNVRFWGDEIQLIEEALKLLQDDVAASDEKKYFRISKLIKHLYIDEDKAQERHVNYLEARGYKVVKLKGDKPIGGKE